MSGVSGRVESIALLTPLLVGLLVAFPASAQDVIFGDDNSLSNMIFRLEASDSHLELRSGVFSSNVPGLEFKYDNKLGVFALFPTAAGKPDRFVLRTDGLYFEPAFVSEFEVRADGGGVVLASDNPSQRYLADADDDDGAANHIWYENKVGSPGDPIDYRMMQLTQESGGTLYVDGPVVQNHTFDLAETFWEAEPVAPGEVVVIHPGRANSVSPASDAYQETLLGVVSTRPGFLLGGAPFSLAELEAVWGREIVDEFHRERPLLELELLRESPDLEEKGRELISEATFTAAGERRRAAAFESGPRAGTLGEPSPASRSAAYRAALHDFEITLRDLTLRRFFEERFAAVALAGRVPVKVDASFGSIVPGDSLTSSPVPGVAMKATRPGPVIGTALEAHSGGAGVIEVFVHRGWYGGSGARVGGIGLAARAASMDPRDREIAELRKRLTALEARLESLTPPRAEPRTTAR